mmetsp:Transcript_36789/g.67911  ORF Transcript_36789/g.67911 Transcript_36789/m.67911 type:complete len:232 (+) Transcript_36789:445-1140(+)
MRPVKTGFSLWMRNWVHLSLEVSAGLSNFSVPDLPSLIGVRVPDSAAAFGDRGKLVCDINRLLGTGSLHFGTGENVNFFQSMSLKNSWDFSCSRFSAPRRFDGSKTKSFEMRSLATLSMSSGYGGLHSITFWNVRYSLAPRNGGFPTSMWYTMQPSDQRSQAGDCFLPSRTSGDTYSAVPTQESASFDMSTPSISFFLRIPAVPKSVSFKCLSFVSKRFSGFRSRWMMPLL